MSGLLSSQRITIQIKNRNHSYSKKVFREVPTPNKFEELVSNIKKRVRGYSRGRNKRDGQVIDVITLKGSAEWNKRVSFIVYSSVLEGRKVDGIKKKCFEVILIILNNVFELTFSYKYKYKQANRCFVHLSIWGPPWLLPIFPKNQISFRNVV